MHGIRAPQAPVCEIEEEIGIDGVLVAALEVVENVAGGLEIYVRAPAGTVWMASEPEESACRCGGGGAVQLPGGGGGAETGAGGAS